MAGIGTSRRHANRANGVSAAGRADWKIVAQIREQIFFRRHVVGGFIIFQSPLLFGCVNLAEIVDANVALIGFRLELRLNLLYRVLRLLIFRRQLLQLSLLVLRHVERGLQLPRQSLVGRLQLRDLIAQPRSVLIFRAQQTDFHVLRVGVGTSEVGQLFLQLFHRLLGVARRSQCSVLLLVGRKKEKFAGQQCNNTNAQKQIFKFHGNTVFALSAVNVKQEMRKSARL